MTRQEATWILTRRYHWQRQEWPVGMAKIPLRLYLARNLAAAMRIPFEQVEPRWWGE